MKTKWKIIVPVLIVAALAAAFFLQGGEPEVSAPAAPVIADAEPVAGPEPQSIEPGADAAEPVTPAEAEADPVQTDSPVIEVTEGPLTVEASEVPEAPASEPVTAIEPETPSEEPAETLAAEEPVPQTPAAVEAAEAPVTEEPAPLTVTISISCATINSNIGKLDPAKTGLVPPDGWILKETVAEFNEGESVFNVLQRVCKQNKIHMEYMNTPVYNSAYIEGINNLYEFDCGELSGWMYSVNGWYPNFGCSRYTLKDGDVICWRYTCDLGFDIGGGFTDGESQKDD